MRAIVTGAAGLVGSSVVNRLIARGFHVLGIENDMRSFFFGPDGSTKDTLDQLLFDNTDSFKVSRVDIRNSAAMAKLVMDHEPELIVHTAAQPSHDWAATNPQIDFEVNAVGTLNMLEAARVHAPDATFCHISTSKVYGDTPNRLNFLEKDLRLDLPPGHEYHGGISTSMSIDQSKHSLFGVSKAAGDLLAQEYGRYFGMPVVIFRPGCVTGSQHAGVEMHGFLSYLVRCALTEKAYTIYGYGGKQVRCNIHADDLADACLAYHDSVSKRAGAVYNIGGGRASACSVLEAISLINSISGATIPYAISPQARIGDHRWWISDIEPFKADHPGWNPRNLEATLIEMFEGMADQWT